MVIFKLLGYLWVKYCSSYNFEIWYVLIIIFILFLFRCLLILYLFVLVNLHNILFGFLGLLISILLLNILDIYHWIQFTQNAFVNKGASLFPQLQLLIVIRSQIAIEMQLLNSLDIIGLFILIYSQKVLSLLIPFQHLDSVLLCELDELTNLKHVVLLFEREMDIVGSQWDHLNAFEFGSYFDGKIIES